MGGLAFNRNEETRSGIAPFSWSFCWLAAPCDATAAALFTMTDTQFKSYVTHKADVATRRMSITADQLDQYRDKCSSGDSKACMTVLALGRMSGGGDLKYFDLYARRRIATAGSCPSGSRSSMPSIPLR